MIPYSLWSRWSKPQACLFGIHTKRSGWWNFQIIQNQKRSYWQPISRHHISSSVGSTQQNIWSTQIFYRYYSLIKLCSELANDHICWLNAQIMLIAIVPWKRRSISRKFTDLLLMVAKKKWKFLRRRHTRRPKHFTPSSNRCFIYKRKSHFEKNLSIKEGLVIKVNWFSGPKFIQFCWWRSWILILTYEWDHSWYHNCCSRWKFWWWDLWTLPSPTYHFPFTSNIFSPCYHSFIHIC